TKEDFTKGTERYDLILDCISNHSLSACRRVLNPGGKFIIAGGPSQVWTILILAFKAILFSQFVSQKFRMFVSSASKEDLFFLKELIESKKITPVIDRRYTLPEVPEAMRQLETGHASGKIIITLQPDNVSHQK